MLLSMRIRYLPVCVALVGVHIGLPMIQAADDLRTELGLVANDVAKLLRGLDEDSIAIGQFTGPPQMPSSAGPAIAKILSEEFQRQNVSVKLRAKMGIKGEYLDVNDAKTGRLAAQIKGEVVDRTGRVMLTFSRGVHSTATLAALLGVTVNLPADGSEQVRDEALKKSLDAPTADLRGSRVQASSSSPYSMEILVASGSTYLPRPAEMRDGLAFAAVNRNEIYAVRLYNDSRMDAAVRLTIDGMDMFTFSDERGNSHIMVPAGESALIRGWFRNTTVSDAFLVTEYSKSAAAQVIQNNASIGVVTASFAAAWPIGSPPPADESLALRQGRAANATARGPLVRQKYEAVQRQVGAIRSVVSIRYSR